MYYRLFKENKPYIDFLVALYISFFVLFNIKIPIFGYLTIILYMCVDGIHNLVIRSYDIVLHHVISIISILVYLKLYNQDIDNLQKFMYVVLFAETSNIFLSLGYITTGPTKTICRIVHIISFFYTRIYYLLTHSLLTEEYYLFLQNLQTPSSTKVLIFIGFVGIFIMSVYWWIKIERIIFEKIKKIKSNYIWRIPLYLGFIQSLNTVIIGGLTLNIIMFVANYYYRYEHISSSKQNKIYKLIDNIIINLRILYYPVFFINKDISNTILFICVISIVYSYIGLIEQKNSKYPLMIYVLNTVSLLLTTYLISNNVSDIIFNHFMILLIAINYYRYRNEKKTTMYFVHIYISLIMFNYQIS